jgi:hypothetical protein
MRKPILSIDRMLTENRLSHKEPNLINLYEAKPTAQQTENHIKNTIEKPPVGFAGFAERSDFETYPLSP